MMSAQDQEHTQQGARPETLTGLTRLQSRRSHAFAVGESMALERTISADAYVFLYKELVRLCKDGSRCWPGLDWLVDRLGTSEGTIKRWLAELVKADLIRRTPRPGGMTTLTTVVPLEAFDANAYRAEGCDHERSEDGLVAHDVDISTIFFLPPRERTTATPAGSQTISHIRLKSHLPNQGGGTPLPALDITESARLLQQGGVLAPAVLDELKHVPIDDIERCFAVARSRPHVVDAAGFAVALLRRRAARSGGVRQPHATGGMRSLRAAEGHAQREIVHAPASGEAQPPGLGDLWRQVLDQLRASIDGSAFETWCVDTTLEGLDTVAVVGAATCFQRDALERQFNDHIVAALTVSTGKVFEVRYVVRSPILAGV